MLTCHEQHTAVPCWGGGWLQAPLCVCESRAILRRSMETRGYICLKWCTFDGKWDIFKPGSRLLKKISDSFLFQNSLKLHERNKAGLFDSILMLGLKKFTSEFSSLTGQEMHIKKKKKLLSDNHPLSRTWNESAEQNRTQELGGLQQNLQAGNIFMNGWVNESRLSSAWNLLMIAILCT